MYYKNLETKKSEILTDVKVFKPTVNYDIRGCIFTTYHKEPYNKYLPKEIHFVHDKFAISKYNVLRGLHGDNKTWKLITCIKGEIFEVVVDNRPTSKTYLKYESWRLNDRNKLQILIPPNYVNGYYVLSDEAIFHYKLAYDGAYFDVKDQVVIKWNDQRLNINWPTDNPILQNRDK